MEFRFVVVQFNKLADCQVGLDESKDLVAKHL